MGRQMTRDEALKRLQELAARDGDPEIDHSEADDILLALIDDKEISETFDAITKWYA